MNNKTCSNTDRKKLAVVDDVIVKAQKKGVGQNWFCEIKEQFTKTTQKRNNILARLAFF